MLDWHLCQICYPLEIKLLYLLLLLLLLEEKIPEIVDDDVRQTDRRTDGRRSMGIL